MKKYLIAVAALGLLAACSGNSTKNVPVEVEEETMAIDMAAPDAPSLPILPEVKEKAKKPVNMRDSLKIDKKKGAVIQKKYKGTVPSASGSGVEYDLTLYFQQDSDDGVYEMDAVYLDNANGKNEKLTSTGKRHIQQGTPTDAAAVIYELIPSDGSATIYLLVEAEGSSLTLLNKELQKAASDLNYTLNLVQ